MAYVPRILDRELAELFPHLAAIAIDGPKAVGKTTTASRLVRETVRLDRPGPGDVLRADPESLLTLPRPVLIDEWQKVPQVWDVIRRAVDNDPSGGQFLLTGSAAPVSHATVHSGAGRIGRLRMRPMTLAERGLADPTVSLSSLVDGGRPRLGGRTTVRLGDYVDEIVASGFPGIRPLADRARRFQLDSYLRTIVDRDVPEQGLAVRRPEAMLAWLRAYAAATATTANYTQILDAATPGQSDKPVRSTSEAYRQVLTELWLLDPVPAWIPSANPFSRLQRAPKHHLADPALAARLLGLSAASLLDGDGRPLGPQAGTMLGHLFESLATLCVRVPAQAAEASVGHLRTGNGTREVDLLVIRADGKVLAVEVKLAVSVDDHDVKQLHWLGEQLGDQLLDAIVINTGPEAYRRADGIGVVPLALLAP